MLRKIDLRGAAGKASGKISTDPAQSSLAELLPVLAPDPGRLAEQRQVVQEIIAEVRAGGDAALLELARRFDQAELTSLSVPRQDLTAAAYAIDPEAFVALLQAAARIGRFHLTQLPETLTHDSSGISIRQRFQPVASAGLYVPGGRAAYPSTVLMTAVVARVAQVERIVMCVPPDSRGRIPAVTLAAAAVAGVDEVHPVGGAGAIAAMAYGTETIAPVDVIAGPGNAYVSLAQREVAGDVGIATPYAGPSEIVVVADADTNAHWAAADLLTQSEHGPDGRVALVATDEAVLDEICGELADMVAQSPRQDDVTATLAAGGWAALVTDLEAALEVVDQLAPEHLQLMCAHASELADQVKNAGAVFCGPLSSVALGDYIAGPSHVLPTGGAARFASGLQVNDFHKSLNIITVSESGFAEVAGAAAILAEQEGLLAHRDAILARQLGGQAILPEGDPANQHNRVASRSHLAALERYHSPQVEADVRLNTNESPLPLPEKFRQAAAAAMDEIAWQRYPERDGYSLRHKLADHQDLKPEQLFVANGSNEVIQTLLMCYGGLERKVLVFEPSYLLHAHIAQSLGSQVVKGQRNDDFTLDWPQAERLALQHRPSVIFLCSPNNPTGIAEPLAVVENMLEVAQDIGALLVVDEAYVEFSPHSVLPMFDEDVPLAITRTFSKTWGLAAARLGYVMAPGWVCCELEKVALPYRLNQLTQTLGELALDFEDEMLRRSRSIMSERQRICDQLTRLGVRFWPSAANFVLFRDPAVAAGSGTGSAAADASEAPNPLWEKLLERSVLVRDCSSWPRLAGCLRVTVGTPAENDQFLEALEDALG